MLLSLCLGALVLGPTTTAQPDAYFAARAAAAAHAAPSSAQDDEEKPDKREEIKDLLKQLKEYAGARGDEDDQAVGVIDQLVKEFPESGPKDQADIVEGIAKCFKEKRKELDDGVPDNRLYLASAVALGTMGEEAAKPLSKLVGHKDFEDDLELQRKIVLALGNTKSEKYVDTLLDTLKHHLPEMQAYAAEALGSYEDKPEDQRKEYFEEILKILMGVRAQVDTDTGGSDTIARDRWETIRNPMMGTLTKLSGQEIRDEHEWQAWWNNHKKDDWDEGRG